MDRIFKVILCTDDNARTYNYQMQQQRGQFVNLMFVWSCVLNMKWRVRPTRCNNYDLLIIH